MARPAGARGDRNGARAVPASYANGAAGVERPQEAALRSKLGRELRCVMAEPRARFSFPCQSERSPGGVLERRDHLYRACGRVHSAPRKQATVGLPIEAARSSTLAATAGVGGLETRTTTSVRGSAPRASRATSMERARRLQRDPCSRRRADGSRRPQVSTRDAICCRPVPDAPMRPTEPPAQLVSETERRAVEHGGVAVGPHDH